MKHGGGLMRREVVGLRQPAGSAAAARCGARCVDWEMPHDEAAAVSGAVVWPGGGRPGESRRGLRPADRRGRLRAGRRA